MRICIIGKYPPIEGGVSTETYWSARGLASKGHTVFVVTNAGEVEEQWRMQLTPAEYAGDEYEGKKGSLGGVVQVTSTERSDQSRLYHIPFNNPSVTRLATIATNIVRAERCDVIFGFYLEPYGVAAHMASHWTGVPYVVKHAGSDLLRLARLPELRTTYVEVLKAAQRVISAGGLLSELLGCGILPKHIVTGIGSGVPTEYFHPEVKPIAVDEFVSVEQDPFRAPLEKDWPILGIYGKLGETKGSLDLLWAIARLHQDGFPLHLIAMAHGRQEGRFRQLVHDLGLARQVRIWPFIPNWRMPSFIRRCTAVAFLERDFEFIAHTPVGPREVIACATGLVVSEEVARKQPFRAQIKNGRNVIVVRMPQDHAALSDSIRYVLEDPIRAAKIGWRGHCELKQDYSYERSIDDLEALLAEVTSCTSTYQRQSISHDEESRLPLLNVIRDSFPLSIALLDYIEPSKLQELIPAVTGNLTYESLLDFTELAGSHIHEYLTKHANAQLAAEVCRYERRAKSWRVRRRVSMIVDSQQVPIRTRLSGKVIPRIACEYEIATFMFDLRKAIAWARAGYIAKPKLDGITQVVFSLCANPMIMGAGVSALLDLMREGTLTICEIERILNISSDVGAEGDSLSLCSIIESLHWAGIVSLHAGS